MKALLKEPCNECPWRRKHPAGWLGGYEPEEFTQQVQFDGPPLPCHKTIPEGGEARAMCAGALIFMRNNCKSAQHPDYGDALSTVQPDRVNVFSNSKEFLDHHKDFDGWAARIAALVKGDPAE